MVEVNLELRRGPITIRVSGEPAAIGEALNEVMELLVRVERKWRELGLSLEFPSGVTEEAGRMGTMEEGEVPVLRRPESIREAVSQLLFSEWGRRPRSIGEILEALEANAVYYPRSSVTKEITRMVRAGILRRLKTQRGYKYVPGSQPPL